MAQQCAGLAAHQASWSVLTHRRWAEGTVWPSSQHFWLTVSSWTTVQYPSSQKQHPSIFFFSWQRAFSSKCTLWDHKKKSQFVCLSTVITYVTLVSPQVLYLERAKNKDVSETTEQSKHRLGNQIEWLSHNIEARAERWWAVVGGSGWWWAAAGSGRQRQTVVGTPHVLLLYFFP